MWDPHQSTSQRNWKTNNHLPEIITKEWKSDKFAHTVNSGNKVILVASVILGKVKDYGTETKYDLQMLPLLPNCDQTNFRKAKYDSTSGITGDARVYMTYDNCKAYPRYIIHYKMSQ